MKKNLLPIKFKHFQVKVTLILILSMIFILLLSNLLIYQFTRQSQFDALRKRLMMISQIAALYIDAEKLKMVPLNHAGFNNPEFKEIQNQLRKIKQVAPEIRYIYTMTKTQKEGIWQFIVDEEPLSNDQRKLTSLPGDTFEAYHYPEMMKSFDGPAADTKLEIDQWGVFLSGYAPIHDKNGQAIAILGVDVSAKDVYLIHQEAQKRTVVVSILGLILSIILGTAFSKTITSPIQSLALGTNRIAQGDLLHRVPENGEDELGSLAKSFNHMARNLYKSRRRILRYFHDVVRTLVRVLEARDEYTKGHSKEVAEQCAKIAKKLGLPNEDIKLFKKMAILHDIGKVGIKDSILNKPGALTPQEYEKIKEHPVIGEEILKPVLDNKEMLSAIRHHHERYDGTGYPDKIKGESISIYAAIVSVADTYHAMISDRSYRKALTKEEAIIELKKNKGSQFHPKIVEVFLEILSEEDSP